MDTSRLDAIEARLVAMEKNSHPPLSMVWDGRGVRAIMDPDDELNEIDRLRKIVEGQGQRIGEAGTFLNTGEQETIVDAAKRVVTERNKLISDFRIASACLHDAMNERFPNLMVAADKAKEITAERDRLRSILDAQLAANKCLMDVNDKLDSRAREVQSECDTLRARVTDLAIDAAARKLVPPHAINPDECVQNVSNVIREFFTPAKPARRITAEDVRDAANAMLPMREYETVDHWAEALATAMNALLSSRGDDKPQGRIA